MTTGASLNPDSASSIPTSRGGSGTRRRTEKTAAASVEEMAAPSRRASGQSRNIRKCAAVPATATETQVQGGQQRGRCDRRLDRGPTRGQTAFGQDQNQCGVTQNRGQLGVVELQTEATLADREAQGEIDQQRREATADRETDGSDCGEQHGRAGEQRKIELLDRQAVIPSAPTLRCREDPIRERGFR